ncbi:MAG: helix-turn-helix transcriptional regulator [bacterium]
MNIGEKIFKLREESNLSQTDLAELLDVSRQTISKWECGNCEPEVTKVVKLSKIFKVSTDYLLGIETNITTKTEKIKDLNPIINLLNSISIVIMVIGCIIAPSIFTLGIVIYILALLVPTIIVCYICKTNKSDLYKRYIFILSGVNAVFSIMLFSIIDFWNYNEIIVAALALSIPFIVLNNIYKFKFFEYINIAYSLLLVIYGCLFSYTFYFSYPNLEGSSISITDIFDYLSLLFGDTILVNIISVILILSLIGTFIYSFIKKKQLLPIIVSIVILIIQISYYAISSINKEFKDIDVSFALMPLIILFIQLILIIVKRTKTSTLV